MRKVFFVANREGKHGLDIVLESNVTGEVFLLLLENPHPDFPLFDEVRSIFRHIGEVRQWVKDGVIKFAGKQVVYERVYF